MFDRKTGNLIWGTVVESATSAPYQPVIANGIVYAVTGAGLFGTDGHIYGWSAANGGQIGVYQNHDDNYGPMVVAGPDIPGNIVYAGANQDGVFAFGWNVGLLWHARPGSRLNSKSIPAAAGSLVYIGEGDSNLYALNASDGSIKWHYQADDYIDASPQVVNNVVYFGTVNCGGNLCDYALDALTGKQIWRAVLRLSSCGGNCNNLDSDLLVYNGAIYGESANDQTVYALDAQSGNMLWSITLPNTGYLQADSNILYVDTPTGVTAINMSDHTIRWTLQKNKTTYTLLEAASGVVYVSQVATDSQAENIDALKGSNGGIIWSTQVEAPQPTPVPTP